MPPLAQGLQWQFFRRVGRRGTGHVARGAVAEWSPRQVRAAAQLTCCADPRRGRPGRVWRARRPGVVAPVGVLDPLLLRALRGRSRLARGDVSRPRADGGAEGGDGCERRRRAARPRVQAAGRRPVPARAPAGGAPHGAPPQHVDVRVSQLGGGSAGKVKDAGRERGSGSGEDGRDPMLRALNVCLCAKYSRVASDRARDKSDATRSLWPREVWTSLRIQPCCVQLGPATIGCHKVALAARGETSLKYSRVASTNPCELRSVRDGTGRDGANPRSGKTPSSTPKQLPRHLLRHVDPLDLAVAKMMTETHTDVFLDRRRQCSSWRRARRRQVL